MKGTHATNSLVGNIDPILLRPLKHHLVRRGALHRQTGGEQGKQESGKKQR
jgi:hypothetical protein